MKPYKLIILGLAFFVGIQITHAQYAFRVLASSDTSTVRGKRLIVGTSLSSNDQILVANNRGYLSLVHKTGGTVEIGKAGTYLVKDLEAGLAKKKQSTTQRYANYIIGELTKSGDKEILKHPYKYQNVTGSVERATFPGEIVVRLPKTTPALKSEYRLKWHHLQDAEGYIVQFMDEFDAVVKKIEIEKGPADTTTVIDLSDPALVGKDLIQVVVASKKNPDLMSLPSAIKILEGPEAKDYQALYDEKKFPENPTATDKLLEAIFFEYEITGDPKQGFLVDAMAAYEEAMMLNPESTTIPTAYNQFLIRHGIGKYRDIQSKEKAEAENEDSGQDDE